MPTGWKWVQRTVLLWYHFPCQTHSIYSQKFLFVWSKSGIFFLPVNICLVGDPKSFSPSESKWWITFKPRTLIRISEGMKSRLRWDHLKPPRCGIGARYTAQLADEVASGWLQKAALFTCSLKNSDAQVHCTQSLRKTITTVRLSDITSPALFPFNSESKRGLRQRKTAWRSDTNFSKGKKGCFYQKKSTVVQNHICYRYQTWRHLGGR